MEIRSTLARGVAAALLAALAGCSSVLSCPGDTPEVLPVATTGGFATYRACEVVRTAASCPAPTGPSAACAAHCASGTWGNLCKPSIASPAGVLGLSCSQRDTSALPYAYSCAQTATCHCS